MKPQQETGITFRFFKFERKDGRFVSNYSEGNKNSPNGFYKNGEIYIDINAGANGEGLILFTASHELVHFMRDFAPEQFDGFAKFLFDNYAKRGLSVRQAVRREMMMHQKLKYDEAYEEVVARLSESFLRDAHLTEKSAELYNTDKNIWEKVRDGLKSIVDRIEKHFAGVSPESDLGKIGKKMARENREILDRFVAGVKTAAENAAYTEKTTDDGGVRMMVREENDFEETHKKITPDLSDRERYNILKSRTINNIPAVTNEKLAKAPIQNWDDIDKLLGKQKQHLIDKLISEFGVIKDYRNSDVNLKFTFSKNNFRESYHNQKKNYVDFSKMFSVFDDVVINAVGVEVHNRNKKGYKSDPSLKAVYVLVSAFRDGEYIVPVKLEIKEFRDKANGLYVAIALEKVKATEVSKQGNTKTGVTQNSRSVALTNISIAQLFKKINPKDGEFIKYIPDDFLDREQLEAKGRALKDQKNKTYLTAIKRGDMQTVRSMVEAAAKAAGFDNAIPEQTLTYSIRTGAAPKKTVKVYKVFTVADDGSPTALFVSGTEKLPQNVWLDAQDTWHFTGVNGLQYVPSTKNPYTKGGKTGGQQTIPNEEVRQELIKRGFISKGSKTKTVTALAYRPGWHAGDLPFFPQGGMQIAGSNYKNVHRYNQVVFECELDADKDYTSYHKNGEGKTVFHDMETMPKNGYYKFATNPMANSTDIGSWYISGSLKILRALTEEECNEILRNNGRPVQEWQQYQDKVEIKAVSKDKQALHKYEHTMGSLDLSKLGYTGERYDAARKTLAPITYDDNGDIIPLSERFNPDKPDDVRYDSRDADYLSAVNRGDMETAQRMVDEAAERAFVNSKVRGKGKNLLKMYHGTDSKFTVFDPNRIGTNAGTANGPGFYFSSLMVGGSELSSDVYGNNVGEYYLNIENPIREKVKTIPKEEFTSVIDRYETEYNRYHKFDFDTIWDEAKSDLELYSEFNDRQTIFSVSNSDVISAFSELGFDGAIIPLNGGKTIHAVVFNSSQVKSADPVTYDDNGKVIPLSQRFDTSQQDIRYDARDELTGEDDMWTLSEYDGITDAVVRHYTTRSEAIGEVLKNTADIEIAAGKVKNIVSRLMNSRFVGVDSDTKKKLATALHLELENVKNVEPEQVTDRMIDAVRNVIKDAKVEDPTYAALYDDFKTAFSGKYYLTDEQLADLNENGYTLNDFKKAMSGIGTIVDKAKADKSITGGIKGASQLSFEGFNDYSESSIQQLFGINPEQWDEFDYHAPVMMMDAISELKGKREVPLNKMASADDIDYIATQIAAQFTGAVIQEKYNSRRNPYVRDLADKFEQRKKDAVKKRNEYYKDKMKELREQRDRKVAEQQKKYQTAREEATGEMLKFFLVL